MEVTYIFVCLFAVMNILGFALMGTDKSNARNHERRIPEKTLFAVAALGGGMGATAGMYVFHHKTKHWYFVLGFPALAVLNVAVLAIVFFLGLIR